MSSSNPKQRFQDVIDNIDLIEEFSEGFNPEVIMADKKAEYAVRMAFMNIGEAGDKLGLLAEELAPDQPWRQIHGFCNRLRHEYDKIDMKTFCKTVENRLLPLRADCIEAIAKLENKSECLLHNKHKLDSSSIRVH